MADNHEPFRGAVQIIRCREVLKGYIGPKIVCDATRGLGPSAIDERFRCEQANTSMAERAEKVRPRSMAEADDTELLRVARAGDATAFDALIRRHDRFLYRVARSILLDDYEAEDVVQETFIKAFKRLMDFRGEASLSTWLTRIALNEALARKRSQRTTVELEALQQPAQIEPSAMTAPAQDPEVTAAQHQIRRLLERAIDGLPDSLRTVFVMRDVEELSTAEAARLLGLGKPTVKTRLHRARRMLRQILGEEVGKSLNDVFPFERQRCDLLVERVLRQVGLRR
jgi:RNA polymerase sigma-70 factor, ECF subfamily